MALYLVTGGAGFIGSHLVDSLLRDGHQVRVLDNFDSGRKENLVNSSEKIELLIGDVRNYEEVRDAATGCKGIFHLAAMVSVPKSVAQPRLCHDICATGTLNVLMAAKECGVKRVVYAGSSSAYGDAGYDAIKETQPTIAISPYAAAKLAGEHYCSAFSCISNVETVRMRFFNVFGPRQDPTSPYSGVIALFTLSILKGNRPTIFGDGLQSRDFIFVTDVVAGLRAAESKDGVNGMVFNIGTGKRINLLNLVEALNRVTNQKIEPILAAPRAGDILHSLADITAAQTKLGLQIATSFDQGLTHCLDFYRSIA